MDQKQLKALLAIMRKNGVVSYKTPELELTLQPEIAFAEETQAKRIDQQEIPSENPYVNFPDGELSPEQLAFYSSGGDPLDDPFRKES